MSLSRRVKIGLTAAVIAPALVFAPTAVAADLPGSGDTTGSLGSLSSLGSLGSSGSSTTPDESETPERDSYPAWFVDVVDFVDEHGFPPGFLLEYISAYNDGTDEDREQLFTILRNLGLID